MNLLHVTVGLAVGLVSAFVGIHIAYWTLSFLEHLSKWIKSYEYEPEKVSHYDLNDLPDIDYLD